MGGLAYTTGRADEAPNVFDLLRSGRRAFESAMKRIDVSDAAAAVATIERLRTLVVAPMAKVLSRLEEVGPIDDLRQLLTNPFVTPEQKAQVELWEALRHWISEALLAAQRAFEVLLDAALDGLDRKDTSGIDTMRRALERLVDENASTWSGLVVDASRTDWRRLVHRDWFRPKLSRRFLPFEFWTDERPDRGSEVRLTLSSLLEARRRQVDLLEKLGGVAVQSQRPWRSSLHASVRWRQHLLRAYQQERSKGGKAERALLQAVMGVWPSYLSAMTVSTRYNVIDSGDERANYLKRRFPRAASGQLVHDCGVHMLRSAFAFSGLPLSSYAVVVPNHVGLVAQKRRKTATGPTLADGPVFVVHNASVGVVEAGDLSEVVAQWRAAKPPDPDDAEQFLADLFASQYFRTLVAPTPEDVARSGAGQSPTSPPVVVGVDAPFVLSPFPTTRTSRGRKDAFWKDYKKLVASTKLFKDDGSGDGPSEGLALRYLEYRAEWNRLFNAVVLPLWNERLPRAHRQMLQTIIGLAEADLVGTLGRYHTRLAAAYERIFQHFVVPLSVMTDEVNDILNTRAEVAQQPGVGVAVGGRLSGGERWFDRLVAYVLRVKEVQGGSGLRKEIQLLQPPFEEPLPEAVV